MYKTHISRKDFEARLDVPMLEEMRSPASSVWLEMLLVDLQASGEDIRAQLEAFRSAADGFFSDEKVFGITSRDYLGRVEFRPIIALDRLRWELSRVPVSCRLETTYPPCPYDDTRSAEEVLAHFEGQTFYVGTPNCPQSVFPVLTDFDEVGTGNGRWCFYPPELAGSLGFSLTPTWDESDSVVDWIMDFVENEGYSREPRLIKVGEETESVWSFYRMSVDGVLPAAAVSPVQQQAEIKAAATKPVAENVAVFEAAAAEAAAAEMGSPASEDFAAAGSEAAAAETDTALASRILREKFLVSAESRLSRTSVYEVYTASVHQRSRTPMSAGKFYRLLREVYPQVIEKTPRLDGKAVRCFIGLARVENIK